METYYAVCDGGDGPISKLLDAQCEGDALAELEAMDGRAVWDEAPTDLEDALGLCLQGASYFEAERRLMATGAEKVHGGYSTADWDIYVVEAA